VDISSAGQKNSEDSCYYSDVSSASMLKIQEQVLLLILKVVLRAQEPVDQGQQHIDQHERVTTVSCQNTRETSTGSPTAAARVVAGQWQRRVCSLSCSCSRQAQGISL
jgi:hypothetical protein